jgi:acetyl-CoA carboxylase biotin carboxyl carrier protein
VVYGQVLASLMPLKAAEGEASEGDEQVSAQEGYALEAPIDGTVYYSPSPEAPPFVREGDTITPGQVIALVEVMKFFYEIKHEGDRPVTALKRGVTHGAPIEAGGALWFVSDQAEGAGGGEA